MFNRMVLFQKAKAALRAGRLDEAYEVAAQSELKDHRQGQEIREQLVDPLLDRAEDHLAAGRKRDALADVERAQELGGNRPRTADLRERILSTLRDARRDELRERAVLESVRNHIGAGRVDAAESRLATLPTSRTARKSLENEVHAVREAGAAARSKVRSHLEHKEVLAAIEGATRDLLALASDAETRDLILEATRAGETEALAALSAGRLERVEQLGAALGPLRAAGFGEGAWEEPLRLSRAAADAISTARWELARIAIGKMSSILPRAKWLAETAKQVDAVERAVVSLRSGPLGLLASAPRRGADPAATLAVGAGTNDVGRGFDPQRTTPVAAPGAAPLAKGPPGKGPAVLWVDGVGSFLVMPAERVTIGRAGSSARPDIALSADLEGVHAEILRVDGDHFIVARGPVSVAGRRVDKHLLADGDEVVLGKRAKITFRAPSALTTTGVLELGSGLRVHGDVRQIVLVDEHLLIGNKSSCHVVARDATERLVLSAAGGAYRLKASEPIVIDNRVRGEEEPLAFGATVEASGVTFTITAAAKGGREA